MKMYSRSLVMAACFTAALSSSALAGSYTYGSYVGVASAAFSNSAITYSNTAGAGTVVAESYPYSIFLPGTQFVTYQDGFSPASGATTYTTALTNNLIGYGGTVSVAADDTVSVFLNNVAVGNTNGTTWDTLETFILPAGVFSATSNILSFVVDNTGGPTALDFAATVVTPEPSSLVLLGSGMISAISFTLRKRRTR